ncbi:AcrR family transcriptional regulator [Desulfosalsimonas propionicica]|jgi:AcrR family transcriptional regulator|uniref:AcrR family transcriptional regulator n=1 Tax=Desulfosalsimonas propionicica TaxID=332175 RepID=A0A7W0HLQ3_9BACT|nr:TetR/AcrR family transcriptional regulator [Desulfosalsimonas propionicica]MBA2882560.1 AcrR family transcriptional regulator [Desulfosalsimonas propionicica]
MPHLPNTSVPAEDFDDFRKMTLLSMEEICRDIFKENQHRIKIKKEAVAVRNLVNIFHTTLQISNEKGFQTMSLRDLSRVSGLSMGALYSYFSSKDELLEMIQNQGRRITLKILSQRIKADDAPSVQLQTAIRTHLYLTEVLQPWFYFSYMEAKNLKKTHRKKAIESDLVTEEIIREILEKGVEKGEFRVDHPMLTAAVTKAMLQDWYLKRWKYSGRKIPVQAYADFIIEFVEALVLRKSSESSR